MKKFIKTTLLILVIYLNGAVFAFAAWGVDPQDTITNPAGSSTANSFAQTVDISGDRVVVGAYNNDPNGQGRVWIYERNGTNWDNEFMEGNDNCKSGTTPTNDCLKGSDTEDWESFGESVAINGDYIAVSSLGDDVSTTGTGAVYVFNYNGTNWNNEQAILTMDDGRAGGFGDAIAMTDTYLVVGDPYYYDATVTDDDGAIFIYQRSGTSWTLQTTIESPDTGHDEQFGDSVAISGTTIVVGSPAGNNSNGRVYVYTGSGASWSLQQTINNPLPDATSDDQFGYDVSVDGDYLIVGAIYGELTGAGDPISQGTAHVYYRSAGVWSNQQNFQHSDPGDPGAGALDNFGKSLSISGTYAIVGAPEYNQQQGGKAYIFSRSGTTWSEVVDYTDPSFNWGLWAREVAIDGSYAVIGETEDPGANAYVYYNASSGGAVPEFSDYILILTIAIVVAFMFKMVPKMGKSPIGRA